MSALPPPPCLLLIPFLLLLLQSSSAASPGASEHRISDQRPRLVVDTLVTADDTVTRRFNSRRRTRQYLSEIVRLTNVLLRDRHLPLRIELNIVHFEFLSHVESVAIFNTSSLNAAVRAFCAWSHRRFHPLRSYDHGIFFTQRIQSRAAGITPLGKMCEHPLSCTIVEDTGFTFVFNLAHEILHSFGVEHDSEGNACAARSAGGNIMAPTVRSSWAKYQWSACTVKALRALKERANSFPCVEFTSGPPKPVRQVAWSRADQCRVLLGLPEFYEFSVNPNSCPESCQDTWCPTVHAERTCVSYSNVAPPPGFACGPAKSCVEGRCDAGPLRALPMLPWSSCWPCTGSGVQVRTRSCPPADPKCDHSAQMELRSCRLSPDACSGRQRDYRERQCHSMLGPNTETVHFFFAPCVVVCQDGGSYSPIDTVPNGTPCHYNASTDVCVEGKCVAVDCRGRVGGRAVLDACGVCGGNGSSCTAVTMRLAITADLVNGSTLHRFPRGAKDILITKDSPAFSLALVDARRRRVLLVEESHPRMAGVAFGVLLSRRSLPSGFEAIETSGTLLSPDIQLRMRWRGTKRPPSSVEVSYTRAKILNKIQMPDRR